MPRGATRPPPSTLLPPRVQLQKVKVWLAVKLISQLSKLHRRSRAGCWVPGRRHRPCCSVVRMGGCNRRVVNECLHFPSTLLLSHVVAPLQWLISTLYSAKRFGKSPPACVFPRLLTRCLTQLGISPFYIAFIASPFLSNMPELFSTASLARE